MLLLTSDTHSFIVRCQDQNEIHIHNELVEENQVEKSIFLGQQTIYRRSICDKLISADKEIWEKIMPMTFRICLNWMLPSTFAWKDLQTNVVIGLFSCTFKSNWSAGGRVGKDVTVRRQVHTRLRVRWLVNLRLSPIYVSGLTRVFS